MAADRRIDTLTRQARRSRQAGRPLACAALLDDALRLAAAQLADLHGQRAGALRAAGCWNEAVADYDAGHALEQAYATGASYNGLNRLVTRLAQPGPADGQRRAPAIDLDAELAALQARLLTQAAKAEVSAWELGDLALVAALRADRRVLQQAIGQLRTRGELAQVAPAYLGTLDLLRAARPREGAGLRALRQALAA